MPLSTSSSILATTSSPSSNDLESGDHGTLACSLPNHQQKNIRAHSANGSTANISTYIYPKPSFHLESTSSSPSTTISTLNSALTDVSPATSPQSPSSLLQAPFRQPKLNTRLVLDSQMDSPQDDVSPVRPSTSASDSAALRKGRNMKNLSINTNGISARQTIDSRAAAKDRAPPRPVTQSGPAPSFKPGNLPPVSESAPVSPSFIIPKMPPRRKPSKLGLTIATSDAEPAGVTPPTPSFNSTSFAATRHTAAPAALQTIPQTPALPPPDGSEAEVKSVPTSDTPISTSSAGFSANKSVPAITGREMRTPGLAPAGGMTLPPLGNINRRSAAESNSDFAGEAHPCIPERVSPVRQQPVEQVSEASDVVNQTIEHVNNVPAYDRPLSQESKSPSYPHGPACIYPPNVYLYHQPTADEARNFDVIINVAREVTNPFEIEAEEEKARLHAKDTQPVQVPQSSYRSVGVQVELLTEDYPSRTPSSELPQSAEIGTSTVSALQRLSITPAESIPLPGKWSKPQPEYLHLPWEHNSKVYEDWFEICQLIRDRTSRGKRVLIHCQLGVSRSASLIVAYGIFLNPRLSPDEAREQAKGRSRWIDLNMHFMYELGDFKKLLAQKGVPGADSGRLGNDVSSNKPMPLNLSRGKPDGRTLSPVQSVPSTPMSGASSIPASAPLSSADGKDGQFAKFPDGMVRTPGPTSAPTDISWSPSRRPKGMEDETPASIALQTRPPPELSTTAYGNLPPPVKGTGNDSSPVLQTPAVDMPGGWAATPAMSRPTSMVMPEGPVVFTSLTPTPDADQAPNSSTSSSSAQPADGLSVAGAENAKPTRSPSFRKLARIPSLPSGLTNSIGSFFSLKRSASNASKADTGAPSQNASGSSRYKNRLDSDPGALSGDAVDDSKVPPGLRKPPSLPTLRTFFPLGGSNSNDRQYPKPGLSLTLDPIPQSAVGQDEPAMNPGGDFSALMSPRAQEFVSNPFHRPVTSHAALNVHNQKAYDMNAMAGLIGMGPGNKLESVNRVPGATSTIEDVLANHASDAQMNRKASNGSHRTVVQLEKHESQLEAADVRELMSPGAQARDPRSPPSRGVWGQEERVMPSIDDVI